MPRTYEMSDLVTRCKLRSDLANSDHISTAEWKALVSEKYGELFEAVVEASRYFETVSTITATGAASYDEPDDWLRTIRFERVDGTGRRVLMPLMPDERDAFVGTTGDARRYEHLDDQIYLYPNPSSGTYKMLYQPQAPDLSDYDDADLVDVVNAGGEAFLVWGVSVLAKSKGEADVTLAMQREEAAKTRLVEMVLQESLTEGARRPAPDWTHVEDRDDPDWRWRP